jgi:hypothetical protein
MQLPFRGLIRDTYACVHVHLKLARMRMHFGTKRLQSRSAAFTETVLSPVLPPPRSKKQAKHSAGYMRAAFIRLMLPRLPALIARITSRRAKVLRQDATYKIANKFSVLSPSLNVIIC